MFDFCFPDRACVSSFCLELYKPNKYFNVKLCVLLYADSNFTNSIRCVYKGI